MVAIGMWLLPLDFWIKGYITMGILMLVQSCVTLTKTMRDMHESGKLVNRIEDAKAERLLMEVSKSRRVTCDAVLRRPAVGTCPFTAGHLFVTSAIEIGISRRSVSHKTKRRSNLDEKSFHVPAAGSGINRDDLVDLRHSEARTMDIGAYRGDDPVHFCLLRCGDRGTLRSIPGACVTGICESVPDRDRWSRNSR